MGIRQAAVKTSLNHSKKTSVSKLLMISTVLLWRILKKKIGNIMFKHIIQLQYSIRLKNAAQYRKEERALDDTEVAILEQSNRNVKISNGLVFNNSPIAPFAITTSDRPSASTEILTSPSKVRIWKSHKWKNLKACSKEKCVISSPLLIKAPLNRYLLIFFFVGNKNALVSDTYFYLKSV